ncbi:FAD-binding oxidoreductase [Streptomyces sulphureus]|uniref:FAD-binding oxidoreductase n=1 Tax=Streptomyces sulphureus TaxID=47758 RepID=UPI00037CBAE0|nr:FAD-binding oxidoreductase [Streptomyces sulphureus]
MHGHWYFARLAARREENATARTLLFDVEKWPGHLPGQHVDVRLTADDGYQAIRSYSLAAPAEGDRLELGVQPVEGGEVSPYLAEQLPLDAYVEVRGPLGGWFVWRGERTEPVLLLGGGSGIVPLRAMVRARRSSAARSPFLLLYALRSPAERWYAEELRPGADADGVRTRLLYSREAPAEEPRPAGRLTAADLAGAAEVEGGPPLCYVCGPTGFVEHAAGLLVAAGVPPGRVRTERFG